MNIAESLDIPNFAQIPVLPEMTTLCDSGTIEGFDHPYLDSMVEAIEKM